MKLKLDNLIYETTDASKIDRLKELGAEEIKETAEDKKKTTTTTKK